MDAKVYKLPLNFTLRNSTKRGALFMMILKPLAKEGHSEQLSKHLQHQAEYVSSQD